MPDFHDITGERAPTIKSAFHISGPSLDAQGCTEMLGISPTHTRPHAVQRGTLWPSGEPHILQPGWSLEIVSDSAWSTDDELNRLLDLLWPQRDSIRTMLTSSPDLRASFVTTVYITEARPLYHLSPPTLHRLSQFGIEWGLDIYDSSK